MEEFKVMRFEEINRLKIDGMPFIPDEDIYIRFKDEESAKMNMMWMVGQGASYIGLNEDKIYICRSDFLKIAKKMGFPDKEDI
jgi:hypothetical protein